MNILAIDTTSESGSVAIGDDEQLLGSLDINIRGQHSGRLWPAIDQLLAHCKISLPQLNAIAVTIGPGSFTGIRVGLVVARSLAQLLNIPIVGIASLEVLACNARRFPGPICVASDARRNQVYAIIGKFSSQSAPSLEITLPIGAYAPQTLLDHLPKEQQVLFIGSGNLRYGALWQAALGPRYLAANSDESLLRAATLARLAAIKLAHATSKTTFGYQDVLPLYCRLSDAEICLKERQAPPGCHQQ